MRSNHVFISYARRDRRFVTSLKNQLQESQLATWLDLDDIRGGGEWQKVIDDALRSAAALVVVMSPDAEASRYVTYEWAFALGAGVIVIPLLRKPTDIHPRLASIQFIDFTTQSDKQWLKLLEALKAEGVGKGPAAAPKIRASFDLVDGKPEKTGDSYTILLSIDGAPHDATVARYKVHDDTFDQNTWTERNRRKKFATWMVSYGDVLVSAALRGPSGRVRAEVTLYEALKRTHGADETRSVQRALRAIRDN